MTIPLRERLAYRVVDRSYPHRPAVARHPGCGFGPHDMPQWVVVFTSTVSGGRVRKFCSSHADAVAFAHDVATVGSAEAERRGMARLNTR